MNNITSYSVYHLRNLIRCWKQLKLGIKNYDTTIYEKELEDRKTRALNKWNIYWKNYNHNIWKWVKLKK